MFAKPQSEHQWLDHLVGEWAVEMECQMAPDQPVEKSESRTPGRSLGGLWVALEGSCESPEGEPWVTIHTMGYDPQREVYVGTFVGSMMTHLWLYTGTLDASGKKLTLDTQGPSFDQSGMATYQDIIEIVDKDHWVLSSQILGDDGNWIRFMDAHHRRKA